ncbi:MAG: hypothetical protein Q9218_005419 [Villophora microphyllina]
MLSKEDEVAVGKDEKEVRREDQDKINKFSRLHQRETLLEEELKGKAKDKEDLEEISNELELADEDEKIPYKIGDTFVMLPLDEVQELLSTSSSTIEDSVSAVEEKLSSVPTSLGDHCRQRGDVAPNDSPVEQEHDNEQKEQGPGMTSASQSDHRDGQPRYAQLDATDAQQRYQLEKADNAGSDPKKRPRVLSFPRGDPDNPYNWSTGRKIFVLFVGIVSVVNSTLGSSLSSGATEYLAVYWNITSQAQLVLPISLFLVGYVFGPIVFAPLSETYGRRVVLVWTFVLFTIFTMACAVAPNWPFFLVFRLLCGITASSPIAVVGGLYADIYDDPIARGRALAFFMGATTCGPVLSPIISGFLSMASWRWTFYAELIIAGISLIFLFSMPETYGPTILKRRAQKLRRETGDPEIFAPIELEKKGARQLITVTLTRPIRMVLFESIVLFTCLYLSIVYSIFYLYFEAYPLVFEGLYRFNSGTAGLPFLAIGVGAFVATGMFMYWDTILMRAKKANAPWAGIEEYRRLPLACMGAPLFVVALFWLGWTANTDIHWIVPTLSGIPFGMAFLLVFMALLNYITDAYEVFAASAMAATSACRSIFGAVLPLAARPMYNTLGIAWASSLLGFLSLGMCAIPFAFIKYGDRIRANSKFCQELRAKKEEYLKEREQNRSLSSSQGQDPQQHEKEAEV